MTRLAAIFLTALVLAAGTANAENYGNVSRSQAQRTAHMIHLWFDQHGVAECFIYFAWRESGMNPRAYNDDWMPRQGVAGLLQIAYPIWTANNPHAPRSIKRFWHHQPVTWDGFRQRLADPVQSIRLAYLVYRHAGLGPWLQAGGC